MSFLTCIYSCFRAKADVRSVEQDLSKSLRSLDAIPRQDRRGDKGIGEELQTLTAKRLEFEALVQRKKSEAQKLIKEQENEKESLLADLDKVLPITFC